MSNNSDKTRRIAKNTLVLYFRMILLMLIGLYTSRVNLEALGVTDFGIYNVVGGFVALFSLISSTLTSSCSRFLNYEMGRGNLSRLNIVFCSSVTIQYALAIIIIVVAETFGIWYVNNVMVLPADRLFAANCCFQLSVFSFSLNLVTVPYRAAIVAHERMKTFAYVSIFEAIAKLLTCFIVLYSGFDHLILYAILVFLTSAVVRLVYQIYCRRQFEECKYRFVLDKKQLKEIFGYSFWHLIGNSAGILKNQGVNILLNLFFGPSVNAARGIANQVLHSVHGFSSNFMMALNPQITQSYGKGDLNYMFSLVQKGARLSFCLMMVLSLPLIVNTDYLLHIWLTEVPEGSVIFSRLTLITSIVYCLSHTLVTAQNATGKIRNYQIVVGGILLMDFPLAWVALKLGAPPVSVFWVALVIEISLFIARMYMIPLTIPEFKPLEYIKKVVVRCLLSAFVASIIPILLLYSLPETFCSFCLNFIVSFFSAAVTVFFIGCNAEERRLLCKQIRRFTRL